MCSGISSGSARKKCGRKLRPPRLTTDSEWNGNFWLDEKIRFWTPNPNPERKFLNFLEKKIVDEKNRNVLAAPVPMLQRLINQFQVAKTTRTIWNNNYPGIPCGIDNIAGAECCLAAWIWIELLQEGRENGTSCTETRTTPQEGSCEAGWDGQVGPRELVGARSCAPRVEVGSRHRHYECGSTTTADRRTAQCAALVPSSQDCKAAKLAAVAALLKVNE